MTDSWDGHERPPPFVRAWPEDRMDLSLEHQ